MKHTRIIVTHYGGPDALQVVDDVVAVARELVGYLWAALHPESEPTRS